MLIIYNLSGFLVTLAGLVLGVVATCTTGLMSVGVFVASAVWIGGGLWWRSMKRADGTKWAWPAVFFVPMPIWGAVLLVLGGALSVGMDFASSRRSKDPRHAMFQVDENAARGQMIAGDDATARAVYEVVTGTRYSGAFAQDVKVYASVKPEGVLTIVQISNLKLFSETARSEALDAIDGALAKLPALEGKKRYIGIKGKLIFGAVKTPTRRNLSVGSGDDFVEFYGAAPVEKGTR